MENKLFVGSLSWDTSEEALKEAFAQAGTVEEAKIIVHREGPREGQSRGFGFVTMATEEEAQKAIEMWNDKDLDGREIKVSVSKPQEPREDN